MADDTSTGPAISEEDSHQQAERSEWKTPEGAEAPGAIMEKLSPPDEKSAAAADRLSPRPALKQTNGRGGASFHSTRSHGDGHGWACVAPDPEAAKGEEDSEDSEEKQFEVKWDDEDPHNPKNLNLAKKWMVVFIVSAGSTCVTCCSSMVRNVQISFASSPGSILLIRLLIMLLPEKSNTDFEMCTIVHPDLQPNHRGIRLLSHCRHTRAIPVRYGPWISPYGVGPVIRGIIAHSLFIALLIDAVLWTSSHLHS